MSLPDRLSVIVPSRGRDTLWRLLDRGVPQLADGDEWLVVLDTHEMPPARVRALTDRLAAYGPAVRPLALDAGRHSWGHDGINYGMRRASGDYLLFIDDDDVFTPDAFAAIRAAVARQERPRPLLFRFRPWFGGVPLWNPAEAPLERLRPGHIGGHCIVAPNLPGKLGRWSVDYEGDHTFIRQTVAKWGGVVSWEDTVIAVARPQDAP